MDCQLSDRNTQVKLSRKYSEDGDFQEIPQSDKTITQDGQNFSILFTGNKMTFKCEAFGKNGQVVPEPKEVELMKAIGRNDV